MNGFLCTGAQAVLTNLWSVEDQANGVFNGLYYEALLTGKGSPAPALRTAIEKFKTVEIDGKTPYAHPWFWAGYRVVGAV